MKKFCHIMLSVLLSLTILFIGSGVNITRCAHTGTPKVMTIFNSVDGMGNMNCDTRSSCMSTVHVELSPTIVAQSVSYDFHVFQPLLAVLPGLVAGCFETTQKKAQALFIREVWKSPPREYLNFIQVLLV